MAKQQRVRLQNQHVFRDKLLLNQWLISLFGIDPLVQQKIEGRVVRPFHKLAQVINDPRMEGLDVDNIHKFYHNLINSELFWDSQAQITRDQLLVYEENIVKHTLALNEKRALPISWKYFQWLTLVFVEIYLDRYFRDREALLADLNDYVDKFNERYSEYADVPPYTIDDLNKICLQNATGSGKTLLMHVNLMQFKHHASTNGKGNELSRVILLTPNESLSDQLISSFQESSLSASHYLRTRGGLFGAASGLGHVDVLEITKLADQEGPNTIATRSLGDQNLLLVDEGHRGMSGKEEGVWFARRSQLCAKGFTFEYSATFEQAVKAAGNIEFENNYAKAVLFDYSYRWFYEDGFGKDYKIDNLPQPSEEAVRRLIEKGNINAAAKLDNDRGIADSLLPIFLTASLLKFYQQLRIYHEKSHDFKEFNLEKPLWVFVGRTVSATKKTKKVKGKEEQVFDETATDIAKILLFISDFLMNKEIVLKRFTELLTAHGRDTGMLDENGNDIFHDAFTYLNKAINGGENIENIYHDVLKRLFNHREGGQLTLDRIKGDSGEIILRVGASETPFGLINVGDPKGLCDHVYDQSIMSKTPIIVGDSEFSEAMFANVKESSSPINLLIGSKKFVEGWDCWRVSTLGLMHVGQSEGAQIIQLFGRGVRLKGYDWSLKRSGHSHAPYKPTYIEELETLNVFGIEANYMDQFRQFLRDENLPGNERREVFNVPLNVTYDFGKNLKILRPKKKKADGLEYDFKNDAPVPTIGKSRKSSERLKIISDWYPRIQSVGSRNENQLVAKDRVSLSDSHLALLDYDRLYFGLEQFKRERSWYNLNITKTGIKCLLSESDWYTLYMPESRLNPTSYDGVIFLQNVALELLKRYCDQFYNHCKRSFIEPRLELRDLRPDDDNIPQDSEYQLIVDASEEAVITGIKKIIEDLATKPNDLLHVGDLKACNLDSHLFKPLFHVRKGGKITVLPVSLNQSEYQFIIDLKAWTEQNQEKLKENGIELYLLRNLSRGKGVGFFEAGNFHPDFILWIWYGGKQHISFIEPHGLVHEGLTSEKIQFHKRIKEIEGRLNGLYSKTSLGEVSNQTHDAGFEPDVALDSFVMSVTPFNQLKWGQSRSELEEQNVLFMNDDKDRYIGKLFSKLGI